MCCFLRRANAHFVVVFQRVFCLFIHGLMEWWDVMCFFSMLCILGSRSRCEFYCPMQEQGCLTASYVCMYACVCVYMHTDNVVCTIIANVLLCVCHIVCIPLDIYIFVYREISCALRLVTNEVTERVFTKEIFSFYFCPLIVKLF